MKQKVLWGVILAWLLCMLLYFLVQLCRAENIELQWDYEGGPADGFHIYMKSGGDYADPAATLEYPDGNIPIDVRKVTVDLPVVSGEITNFVFIARTFLGEEQSEPSNKVFYSVIGIPPLVPTTLQGQFDKAQGLIHISWEQPQDDYLTHHWRVYSRIAGDNGLTEIGLIRQDEGLELTTQFDLVQPGEIKTCEFVIVAYRRSGVWSNNSEVLSLEIDRRQVDPVQNLRLNITIPVK